MRECKIFDTNTKLKGGNCIFHKLYIKGITCPAILTLKGHNNDINGQKMEAGCDDHLYSSQTHELLRQHSNLSTYQNINRKIAFYHHLLCCTFSKYVGIWQKNKKTLQVHHLVTGNAKSTQEKFTNDQAFKVDNTS